MKGFWNKGGQDGAPESLRAFLQSISIFSDLSWLELRRLELILHERVYHPDEIIFYEGEPGVGMYLVRSGEIALVKDEAGKERPSPRDPSSTSSQVPVGRPLAKFHQGDFFGEVALLTELPRSATARAVEGTVLLGFFRPDLLNLLTSHPKMGTKVLLRISQIVAQRLVQTTGAKSEVLRQST